MKRKPNQNLRKRLTKKINVKVGYFAEDKGKSPIDNEEGSSFDMVALVNTLNDGTNSAGRNKRVKIPARPFMDISAIKIRKQALDTAITGIRAVVREEKTMREVGNQIGRDGASTIKAVIRDTVSPSNSPVTVWLKGKNDPLVDTGEMQKRAGAKVNGGKTMKLGDKS